MKRRLGVKLLCKQFFCSTVTCRFHVAVRLFRNRSQMTSINVAHEAVSRVLVMFLSHFDVICDLLLNRRTATWNLYVTVEQKNCLHKSLR